MASEQFKSQLKELLTGKFPGGIVEVYDSERENVRVVVVSHDFDEMTEKEKLDHLWKYIESSKLSEQDKGKVILLPWSPAELK